MKTGKFPYNLNFHLGWWFDIPVIVHWSYSIAMIAGTLLFCIFDGLNGLLFPFMFSAVFLCVILHEFGHALMGRRYGHECAEIVLYPIGGAAKFNTIHNVTPEAEFMITIAGPMVNLILWQLLNLIPIGFSWWLAQVNLILLIFNLIPIFPMDGGRIVRATLHWLTNSQIRATEYTVRASKFFILLLGIYGLIYGHISLIAIAVFMWVAGTAELQNLRNREATIV